MTRAGRLPPRDRAHALALLDGMLRIRRFEERCIELYGLERIRGFLHLYIGEEAVAVGAMRALAADDAVVSTYREHGHALARGIGMEPLMAELYGRVEGSSRGRGGSMHVFDAARRFYGGNAIVGGGLPLAVGLALGERMLGRPGVAACFFGEGAVAEGEFHEAMNLAALWRLPALFLCENNLYAMGTRLELSQAQPDLCTKARSYGMPAQSVDGMDPVAVETAVAAAAAAARGGDGPRFLEFRTYRFRAHSMFDPELYRPRAEIEAWKLRGPLITAVQDWSVSGHITAADVETLTCEIDDAIERAVAFAEAGGLEPVAELARDVYAPGAAP